MLKKALFIIVVFLFVSFTSASGAVLDLPMTGQTKCYDASGTEVACTGTGQDGEYQAGTGWPRPRFTRIYCNASGPCANQAADCDANASTDMIKDNLTGLIWARNGDLPASRQYWADALTCSNDLTLCGYSDWRLPNVNELGSLYNSGQSDLNAWLISQGFVNVHTQGGEYGYWSSTSVDTTTYPGFYTWVLEAGSLFASPRSREGIDLRNVWPVRGTTNGVAKIPQTGQTTCYDASGTVIDCSGTGQDGEFMEGVAWPAPRFTGVYCDDNGPCADQEFDCDASDSNDLTLDNLTGLVWTRDANLPTGTKTWADALTYANNASVCGYTDWRVPNREEFRSLANYGTSDLPVWLQVEGGFINVQPSWYWTSTTSASSTGNAWIFRIADCYSNYCQYGSIVPMGKTQPLYVWPVRGQSCSAPDAPDLISPLNAAVGVSLTLTLDWNYVSGATSYDVRVCSNSTCSSVMRSKNVTSSQWTVSPALNQGTTYYWRIRSKNACGNSSWSNIRSFTTILVKPSSPSQLSAKSTSSTQIILTWADNSSDETSFKVYRKKGTGLWSLIATKGANVTSHTNSTATGNTSTTTYSYYVQACNSGGCSPKTKTAVVPYRPTNLSATASSSSKINLAWTDKSSNETGFQIERKSGSCSSTNSWSKIKTVGQNITSYGNTGLPSGKTYSYRVRAYKKSSTTPYAYGYSLYSNCSSAKTP